MNGRRSLTSVLAGVPVVWQAIGIIIAIGAGSIGLFAQLEKVAQVKVDAHNDAALESPKEAPPHPQYLRAIEDLRAEQRKLLSRIEELQLIVEDDVRWRVGFAAADAERDKNKKAQASADAREIYNDLVEHWPCPETKTCVNPMRAAKVSIKTEIPGKR